MRKISSSSDPRVLFLVFPALDAVRPGCLLLAVPLKGRLVHLPARLPLSARSREPRDLSLSVGAHALAILLCDARPRVVLAAGHAEVRSPWPLTRAPLLGRPPLRRARAHSRHLARCALLFAHRRAVGGPQPSVARRHAVSPRLPR